MPRRKPGTLLPIETEILAAALATRRSGAATFHGFGLAETLRDQSGSKALTAHGTLYKALGRLEDLGLLSSTWEDAAEAEGRPRRRLYELTERGAEAAERSLAELDEPRKRVVGRATADPGAARAAGRTASGGAAPAAALADKAARAADRLPRTTPEPA